MRKQLFFEGDELASRTSRFWLLLVLSAIIAGAGVAGDATATVIGAMIVAPLMSPILGIVLAMVLNDRANLVRCLVAVVAGALAVIAIGYLIGLAQLEPVVAATNSQVAARISPKLIDLLAAPATGAVGSVALIRSDISDTVPGVAIGISLVPPLSVVGLVAVPLIITSIRIAKVTTTQDNLSQVADAWAGNHNWSVLSVAPSTDGFTVRAIGPLPIPGTADLQTQLDSAGLGGTVVHVELVPESQVDLLPTK